MAIFHISLNIEVDKSYCIRAFSNKSSQFINTKIKELSSNKTNWSGKIMEYISKIINDKSLIVPLDIVEPHFTTTRTANYLFDKPLSNYDKNDLANKVKNILDSKDENVIVSEGEEVYLKNKDQYNKMNDIQLAHLIILLSEISKNSKKLWCSILLQIRELGMILLYFLPEDGHIALSQRAKVKLDPDKINAINQYINSINEIIDGKRELPNG